MSRLVELDANVRKCKREYQALHVVVTRAGANGEIVRGAPGKWEAVDAAWAALCAAKQAKRSYLDEIRDAEHARKALTRVQVIRYIHK